MPRSISKKQIQEITQVIVKKFHPEKVILFGSFAWGNPDSESDLDLLVVKNTRKRRLERERELRSLLPKSIPFDILVYTSFEIKKKIQQERNLFLEDIINNGKVLYAANKIRI